MTPMTIKYRCDKCEHENTVRVYPIIPGKYSGPPEDCYPAEGGEIDPDSCEFCGAEIDADYCHERVADKYDDQRTESQERD